MSASVNERFEIRAEAFRRMTGYLAPGKDELACCVTPYEVRCAVWDYWRKVYGEAVEATMDAAGKELEL